MAVFRHLVNVDTGASPANLRELEERSDRLERSLRTVETRAGRVGSASTKLAGALGRVSPELAESAMLVNDLADGMEVATMAGPRLIAILGPIAAAAGVAAGAYFVLKSRLDEATAAMEESARQATAMAEVHMQVRDAALMAAVAEGELEQAEFNRIIAARDAASLFAAQRANQQERIDGLNEERAAIEESIVLIKQRQAQLAEGGGSSQGILAGAGTAAEEAEQLSNKLQTLNDNLEQNVTATVALQRGLGILDNAQAKHADNLETVANATGNVTRATREMTEAMKEAAEVRREFDPSQIEGVTPDLGRLLPVVQTEDILAMDKAVTDAMIRANRQQALGQVAGAVQMIGSPTSALTALGPAGAILGGLASIGAAGGASGVERQLDTLIDNVSDGITALPEILSDVIPEFVTRLVTELPPAIAIALGVILIDLFNSLPGVNIGEQAQLSTREKFEREELLNFLNITGPGKGGSFFFGLDQAQSSARSREAASRGRVARADGAVRLAMSRAPTAQMMGSPSLTINALGIDDGTQDQFQRRFARYTDPTTGLRGRDG